MEHPTVLIIDDDRDIVEAIETILQLEEYRVAHAYTGNHGIEFAKKIKPQIILLDYMLPDLTGKNVAEKLLNDNDTKAIPIIIVSAAKEAIEVAKGIPIADFLEKPFDMDTLLELVKKHLT